jgi:hypothetical protein
MRPPRLFQYGLLTLALSLGAVLSTNTAQAQGAPQDPAIVAYAKAWVALNLIRDSMHTELALPKNKKVEDQVKVRDEFSEKIVDRLKALGFTQAKFDSLTHQVSVDSASRSAFEEAVAALQPKKPS